MATNVEVIKKDNENNAALMRRFTRAIQGAKLVRHIRDTRFHKRQFSDNVQKKKRLKQLEKSEKIVRLIKLGKIADKRTRRR